MKVAIVTGAAGGIGYATTKKFIEAGYHVVGLLYSTAPEAEPENIKAKFGMFGDKFTPVLGKLDCEADRENLVNEALKINGRIDVLANIAGVAPRVRADILKMTSESYDFVMGINLKGTFFLTQLVANQMLKQEKEDGIRGYIVSISSSSAYTSSTNRGEYCISKAGVSMMTMLFADKLGPEGILVNEICAGIISTDMTAKVKDKYDALIAGGLVPEGRWGTPEDVAKAVFALSDGTLGYTTGHSIIVDGGMHIRRL